MFKKFALTAGILAITIALISLFAPQNALASGGSGGSGGGGGGAQVDTIKVSKNMYDAPSHELLIKASSSNPTATLSVYLPSGQYLRDIQNGGGSRYGGDVIFIMTDPGYLTIRSSAGGSIDAPTTPFQP